MNLKMRMSLTTRFRTVLLLSSLIAGLVNSRSALCEESTNNPLPGQKTAEQLRADGFTPLFTGEDLRHWNVEPGHQGHWVAENGIINYDGKATNRKNLEKSLWTKESFGDVVLYVEWKLPATPEMKPQPIVLFNGDFLKDENGKRITRPGLDAGDSGIMFRGILNCQANIWSQELGSGEINGYRTNPKIPPAVRRSCIPLFKADRPLGEWNAFEITLAQDVMTVILNGQQVLQSEPLPDLPATGPIGLQHHSTPVQFRNIWVKRLE